MAAPAASASSPGWLAQLEADGFVVVKDLVSPQDCAQFREQALAWLEKFPHGFNRSDQSTWTRHHLPYGITGGLYNRYSVNHEAFVWNIRTQPKIIDVFQRIWKTNDLIASFDGINISLPIGKENGRTDLKPTEPWPHIDQATRNVDRFEMYQGIANLAPNGPLDGGLCVLRGSHLLHNQYFAETGGPKADKEAVNGYTYGYDEIKWYKDHGCQEIKVCAGEGDLIVWDSRTIHWNASPTGKQIRFATYVCYCPRSMASDEVLNAKKEVFAARKGTTHWPNQNVVPADRPDDMDALPRRPDGSVDPANRTRPYCEPDETAAVWKLVGVRT